MKKVILIFTIYGSLAGTWALSPIRLAPKIYITHPEEGEHSSLGVLNGQRSCGGHGNLIQLRYETCQGSGVCQVPGDGQDRSSELEFIPSEDIDALGIRFLVIADGEMYTAYERPISDSSVQAGERYVIHALGGATQDLKGKTVTIQYMLFRVEDDNVEICAEADIEIV